MHCNILPCCQGLPTPSLTPQQGAQLPFPPVVLNWVRLQYLQCYTGCTAISLRDLPACPNRQPCNFIQRVAIHFSPAATVSAACRLAGSSTPLGCADQNSTARPVRGSTWIPCPLSLTVTPAGSRSEAAAALLVLMVGGGSLPAGEAHTRRVSPRLSPAATSAPVRAGPSGSALGKWVPPPSSVSLLWWWGGDVKGRGVGQQGAAVAGSLEVGLLLCCLLGPSWDGCRPAS
jgi:hypothetical protein